MSKYRYDGDHPGARPASDHLIREMKRELNQAIHYCGEHLSRDALNELKALMRLKIRELMLHRQVSDLKQRLAQVEAKHGALGNPIEAPDVAGRG